MSDKQKNRIEWKSKKIDNIDGKKVDNVYCGYVGDLMLFQIYVWKEHYILKILFPYFHQKIEAPIPNNRQYCYDEAEKILVNFLKIILGYEVLDPNSAFIL